MNKEKTSPELEQGVLTQHAMLVAWGLYAEQLGLISKLEGVKLKQKTRRHRPQTKVLEFLVAMLAGLPHLQDISRSAHPLDQDNAVAKAWGQPAWADYSVIRSVPRKRKPWSGQPKSVQVFGHDDELNGWKNVCNASKKPGR